MVLYKFSSLYLVLLNLFRLLLYNAGGDKLDNEGGCGPHPPKYSKVSFTFTIYFNYSLVMYIRETNSSTKAGRMYLENTNSSTNSPRNANEIWFTK